MVERPRCAGFLTLVSSAVHSPRTRAEPAGESAALCDAGSAWADARSERLILFSYETRARASSCLLGLRVLASCGRMAAPRGQARSQRVVAALSCLVHLPVKCAPNYPPRATSSTTSASTFGDFEGALLDLIAGEDVHVSPPKHASVRRKVLAIDTLHADRRVFSKAISLEDLDRAGGPDAPPASRAAPRRRPPENRGANLRWRRRSRNGQECLSHYRPSGQSGLIALVRAGIAAEQPAPLLRRGGFEPLRSRRCSTRCAAAEFNRGHLLVNVRRASRPSRSDIVRPLHALRPSHPPAPHVGCSPRSRPRDSSRPAT